MSLFQSKIWWSTKVSANEEFDGMHMAIGKFGTREDNQRIVVGSFDGKLRVYDPRESPYKPQHMIMEKDEGKPILQVCTMKFNEDSGDDLIVLLFSKGFIVYNFHQGQEGLMLKNEARDENMDRLCYNMCPCYIDKEGLLCIQSQEGMLFFYNKSSRLCSAD